MYGVVLMAALTTGTNAPDCGLFRGCGCCGASYSCNGCNGCYGGCYGCSGCYGCYGGVSYYGACYGCYGCYGGVGYYGACYGCYGCTGCYGGYVSYGSSYQSIPVMPPAGSEGSGDKKEGSKSDIGSKAKLFIDVPADAKLYIDDQLMKTTSAKRAFSTPALEPGQAYYYIVRAEVVRDGKTYEKTQRVIVRAGEQVKAAFKDLEPPVAVASSSGK